MLRFKSIMSRIMFLHVFAMVVTAILIPLALYWFLDSNVKKLQHRAMREQAESLANHLTARPDGRFALDLPAGLRAQYSEAYGRYAYAVVDEAGHVLFSSHANATPIFPVKDGASQIDFFETPPRKPNVSGASLRKELTGRPVFVQVAEDLGHRDVLIDDVVAGFFHRVGWITIPILLVLLAADIVIFRRAVRPLLRASDQAERISPVRIDVRLPTDEIPKEILPLVVAVNQALDRLEQGFRRQREFAADAAHELRTPLAILRTRIETMPDKNATGALHRDVESMSRVVSQLLDAAEVETAVIGKDERADLADVCVGVAEFIAPLAIAQGKTIALSGSEGPVVINGNAEMLRRAVRNLVENALNHTPDGTAVEIVIGEEGMIGVRDEGEGIPAAERELIFQRFWRRDHERAGGAGLGLSIVKRIVDAHGGTIAVENCPTGGANFTMCFPLAEQSRHPAGVDDEPSMFAASAPLAPPA